MQHAARLEVDNLGVRIKPGLVVEGDFVRLT